jgi:hypothetical protein
VLKKVISARTFWLLGLSVGIAITSAMLSILGVCEQTPLVVRSTEMHLIQGNEHPTMSHITI